MDAEHFLRELWGDKPCGFTQLWEMATRRSCYLDPRTPNVNRAILAKVAGAPNVYHAVGLGPVDCGRSRRTHAADVCAIPGLWLDIDVNHDGRKSTDGVPDIDAAHELAGAFLPPTILIHSGRGLHAYYLFADGAWCFGGDAANRDATNMAWGWYEAHRKVCRLWGWGLGGTHDLARLLRLPGTVNAKDPRSPVPVRVILPDGPRHTLPDLARVCAAAGSAPAATWHGDGALIFDDAPEWLTPLLRDAKGVRMAFEHDPAREGWSCSEWDLALATRGAEPKLGLDDAQLASLIVAHRRAHGADERKTTRGAYLSVTVAKARARQR